MNEKEYRTLTKVYGLRFVLTITGQAGKFDLYYLFLSVGEFSRSFHCNESLALFKVRELVV